MNCVLHADFNPPRAYIYIFNEYVCAVLQKILFYSVFINYILMLCFCIPTRTHHPPLYLHWKWFSPSSPIQFSCPNYLHQGQCCTICSYHFVFIKIISLFVSLHLKTGLPVTNSRGDLIATDLWKDTFCAPWKTSLLSYIPQLGGQRVQ